MKRAKDSAENSANRANLNGFTTSSRGSQTGSARRQSSQPAPLLGQSKLTGENEYEVML
jgi:hypothetical protein